MKNIISYLLLFIAITPSLKAQTDSTIYKKIINNIEESKKLFAPDKRTKLVELTEHNISDNNYTIYTTEPKALAYLKTSFQNSPAKIEIFQFPKKNVETKKYGVIQLSVANLRTKTGHASEMATQLLMGTVVKILEKEKGEYRVQTPEGYIAWTPTSSLTAINEDELNVWSNSPKLIYTNDFGKSLSENKINSQRVSDLVYGNILKLLKEYKKFYKVGYPDGRIAYILKNEATTLDKWKNTRNLSAENILKSAKSMLGLPYLWGGTSVKGVDCSGFTKTAYFMNGYIIPRDASQQVLAGEKIEILDKAGNFDPTVALKNLKPADLLFFAGSKADNPDARVTHVALYIGNGEFIHSAGTVRINSMLKDAKNYDDFQTRTVVAARRYIGSNDNQIENIKNNTSY